MSETIFLESLADGSQPGISAAFGGAIAEAAAVCLEDQGHRSPVALAVQGDFDPDLFLQWSPLGPGAVAAWNDEEYATEHGAYAIAQALVPILTETVVVLRSRKKTGFDFWLGRSDDRSEMPKGIARLEVSGIRHGDGREFQARLRRKLRPMQRSHTELPGLVIVVEFSKPSAGVRKQAGITDV